MFSYTFEHASSMGQILLDLWSTHTQPTRKDVCPRMLMAVA